MAYDQKFIAEMKGLLEEKKAQLTRELQGFAETSKSDPGGWKSKFEVIGRSDEDNATEVELYERRRSLESTLEGNLQGIENAFSNITAGTYGTCKHCNQLIKEARLRARPESTSCITCKKKLKGE